MINHKSRYDMHLFHNIFSKYFLSEPFCLHDIVLQRNLFIVGILYLEMLTFLENKNSNQRKKNQRIYILSWRVKNLTQQENTKNLNFYPPIQRVREEPNHFKGIEGTMIDKSIKNTYFY